jgi:hypothetical protein
MVELLKGFPPYVAAYKAQGNINREEYDYVVMRRVGEIAGQFGQINFLVLLETSMSYYNVGVLLDFVKTTFDRFINFNRMAIVSDEKWVRRAYEALGHIVDCEIIGYPIAEFYTAKYWVSTAPGE